MFQKSIKAGWFNFTCLLILLTAFGISVSAATIYGVNASNQLVRFDSSTPANVTTIGTISGLQSGENVLGIDFRPATGQLFGLGSTSRLYTINTLTGAATAVSTTPFTPALSGTDFGFDFNPTVDRIRVVSNTQQNLRLNPNDGTVVGGLADTPLTPGTSNVVGSAYTRNFVGGVTTTLYGIDATADTLVLQGGIDGNPSPNLGAITTVSTLGVNTTNQVGFDIERGSGIAYAALQLNGETVSRLYTINLTPPNTTTPVATALGQIGGSALIRDIAVQNRATVDFDGDGRTDFSVFRPSQNLYIALRSATGVFTGTQFGLGDDIAIPQDFDGDGRTDIAVWRPSNGTFFVQRSSDNTVQIQQFGTFSDEPVARDYDGDGRADFAVARRTNGQIIWFILNSTNNSVRIEQWGADTDVLAPGDYDGDGRFDLSVRRGSGSQPATFFVKQSSNNTALVRQWGLGSDVVAPGDYDGDGRTDFTAVRTGSQYTWFILRSSDNQVFAPQFGGKGHLLTQGDYDGDGRTDVSTVSNGVFFVLRTSNNGVTQLTFGQPTDIPVANFDNY